MELLLLILTIACAALYFNNRRYRKLLKTLPLTGPSMHIDEELSHKLSTINWHDAYRECGRESIKIATCSAMFSAVNEHKEARELSEYAWNNIVPVVGAAFNSLPYNVSLSPHAGYAIDAGANSYLNGYVRGYAVCFAMMLDAISELLPPEKASAFQGYLMKGARDTLLLLRSKT